MDKYFFSSILFIQGDHMDSVKSLSTCKKVLFSILPLLTLIIMGEIAARLIYYQLKSDHLLALTESTDFISYKIKQKMAQYIIDKNQIQYEGSWEALFSEKGKDLLGKFKKEYEKNFARLVNAAQKAQTKLIVLYIPSVNQNSSRSISEKVCRNFYKSLSQKYKVLYFETMHLRQYHWEDVTLLPKNGHLTRFGNRIIANKLNNFIKTVDSYRNPLKPSNEISIYGDLKPKKSYISNYQSLMPFRVVSNRQGFRNINDLLKEKSKQRVLILGDSFTFGPFLPNHDTYPSLLEQFNSKLEVMNAGICGYTITDETSLFIERAQYIAPDITILQVLDNDIFGLFFFKKNTFDRKKNLYYPTPQEINFLSDLQQ